MAISPWCSTPSTAPPATLRAFVQASIRSLKTGKSSDVRFSSTEKIEVIPMMTRKMEYSYKDGEDYVFSDPETFETVSLTPEIVGDAREFSRGEFPGHHHLRGRQGGLHRIAVQRGADRQGCARKAFAAIPPTTLQKPVIMETGITVQAPCSSRPARSSRLIPAPASLYGNAHRLCIWRRNYFAAAPSNGSNFST